MPIPKNVRIKKGKLPEKPGVYLMRDKNGNIIYVGKATSLKSRVSSYFNRTHEPKTAKLTESIKSIDYKETDSVLEALILESRLIKKYKPKYNVKDKDDRSFIHLAVSNDEYPKLLLIRESELKHKY